MSKVNLLSPRELASRTGWSEKRIRDLVSRSELKHLKLNGNILLPPDAINDFISRNMIDPEEEPNGKVTGKASS